LILQHVNVWIIFPLIPICPEVITLNWHILASVNINSPNFIKSYFDIKSQEKRIVNYSKIINHSCKENDRFRQMILTQAVFLLE